MQDVPAWASLAITLVSMVATAAAIYGGIRSELRAMHERINDLQDDVKYDRSRLDTLAPRVEMLVRRTGAGAL